MNQQTILESFQPLEGGAGDAAPCRLFVPPVEEGRRYPLVLCLGERGDGEPFGAAVFADPAWQAENPSFVLEARCAAWTDEALESVGAALYGVTEKQPVDTNRLYVTGCDGGGAGVWRCAARFETVFAAAAPVCGAADPYTLRGVRRLPVWALGAQDAPAASPPLYGPESAVRYLRGVGSEHVRWTAVPTARELCRYETEVRQWLFAQTLEDQYAVEWLRPGLWCILDGMGDTAYLVEGEDKALLIDTAMARPGVLEVVRRLTRLPVELALTHVHGDHMLHADEFGVVYVHPAELEILPLFIGRMMPGKCFPPQMFTPIEDGDVLDLGGVRLTAAEIPGHTPGSMAFIDDAHGCIFTGDAIGSGIGVLMSIMGALPLSVYRESLLRFRRRIEGMEDYVFYGGHRAQEEGDTGTARIYNPLCARVVEDMAVLCEKLIAGDPSVALEPCSSWTLEQAYRARYGAAAMWVCKSQLC